MSYTKERWEETHTPEWFEGEDGRWARIAPRQDDVSENPLETLKNLESVSEPELDDWSIPDEDEELSSELDDLDYYDGYCFEPINEDLLYNEETSSKVILYWKLFDRLIDCIGEYSGLAKLMIKAEEYKSHSAEAVLRNQKKLPNHPSRMKKKEGLRLQIWEYMDALNRVSAKVGIETVTDHEQAVKFIRYLIGWVNTPERPDPSQNRRDWMREQVKKGRESGQPRSIQDLFQARLQLDAKL